MTHSDNAGDRPTKKRRKGCGCWTIALTAFVLLVVVPVAAILGTYLVLRVSDRYELEHELALAREAGYPLTLEELEASVPTSPEIEEATEHWQKAIEIVGSDAYKEASVGVPLVYVDPNPYADKKRETLPLMGERLSAGRAFVDSQRDVFEAVAAARRSGSVARFPVKYEELIHADRSHAEAMRDVANLLRLDAEVHLAEGDVAGAVDALESMLATSLALQNEPNLIVQMMRIGCLGVAFGQFKETLARADLSDEQLQDLKAAFARIEPRAGFRSAFQGERYASQYLTRYDSPIDDPRIEISSFQPFADGDYAKSLGVVRRYEEAAGDDATDLLANFDAIEAETEEHYSNNWSIRRSPVTALTLVAYFALVEAVMRAEAMLELANAALAIERYRLANGKPPASLDELVPSYLDGVPLDPFDGEPLRYRVQRDEPKADIEESEPKPVDDDAMGAHRPPPLPLPPRGAGTLLYSVGENRRDDGGVDDVRGDIVVFVPDSP